MKSMIQFILIKDMIDSFIDYFTYFLKIIINQKVFNSNNTVSDDIAMEFHLENVLKLAEKSKLVRTTNMKIDKERSIFAFQINELGRLFFLGEKSTWNFLISTNTFIKYLVKFFSPFNIQAVSILEKAFYSFNSMNPTKTTFNYQRKLKIPKDNEIKNKINQG